MFALRGKSYKVQNPGNGACQDGRVHGTLRSVGPRRMCNITKQGRGVLLEIGLSCKTVPPPGLCAGLVISVYLMLPIWISY